jgi:putative addiction module component (TIGR02574 family)
MPADLEQLTAQVLALPESSRVHLIAALLASLPHPPDTHSQAWWEEEVERRWQEIVEGKVECIPAEQVFRELEEEFQ